MQTSVDFLVKEFSAILGPLTTQPMQDLLLVDAIQKAKEMQKQHMIEFAKNYGFKVLCGYDYEKAEQYYNETYGNIQTGEPPKLIHKDGTPMKKQSSPILKELLEEIEKEISDEEIHKEADNYASKFDYAEDSSAYVDFIEGIKWYREQLKKK